MTGFKDKLIQLAKSLDISTEDFGAVGIHAWPSIMQKIESAFIVKTNSNMRFNWWWENFKGPQYSIVFENSQAFNFLDKLIDEKEVVWFVGCDINRDPSKFWLFQATVKTIKLTVDEYCAFEYYIISKKYEWLLCETDHNVLIGLGSVILGMKALGQAAGHGH